MIKVSSVTSHAYNESLLDPLTQAVLGLLKVTGLNQFQQEFVAAITSKSGVGSPTIGRAMEALRSIGLKPMAVSASIEAVRTRGTPCLLILNDNAETLGMGRLMLVSGFNRGSLTKWNDNRSSVRVSDAKLATCWSGMVLYASSGAEAEVPVVYPSPFDGDQLVKPSVQHGLLTGDHCKALIRYCEDFGFTRSRVQVRPTDAAPSRVNLLSRTSTSVVLSDRDAPLLAGIYDLCSQAEGVEANSIEDIQCVRYKEGQQFKAHYDSGLGLDRTTTYLFYLNNEFEGGETYFPFCEAIIQPTTGGCVSFPNMRQDKRVLWRSKHAGLPIIRGTKYALNVWIRSPGSSRVRPPGT